MLPAELRALQGPIKERYRTDPGAARVTSHGRADLVPGQVAVAVEAGGGRYLAGLHPATGGSGNERCSGDILLEALVACAGVTLSAVATSMGLAIRSGVIAAEGDWDARGTLGVSREVAVGFTAVRLMVRLDTDASDEQVTKLLELTERYCVVARTLAHGASVTVSRLR